MRLLASLFIVSLSGMLVCSGFVVAQLLTPADAEVVNSKTSSAIKAAEAKAAADAKAAAEAAAKKKAEEEKLQEECMQVARYDQRLRNGEEPKAAGNEVWGDGKAPTETAMKDLRTKCENVEIQTIGTPTEDEINEKVAEALKAGKDPDTYLKEWFASEEFKKKYPDIAADETGEKIAKVSADFRKKYEVAKPYFEAAKSGTLTDAQKQFIKDNPWLNPTVRAADEVRIAAEQAAAAEAAKKNQTDPCANGACVNQLPPGGGGGGGGGGQDMGGGGQGMGQGMGMPQGGQQQGAGEQGPCPAGYVMSGGGQSNQYGQYGQYGQSGGQCVPSNQDSLCPDGFELSTYNGQQACVKSDDDEQGPCKDGEKLEEIKTGVFKCVSDDDDGAADGKRCLQIDGEKYCASKNCDADSVDAIKIGDRHYCPKDGKGIHLTDEQADRAGYLDGSRKVGVECGIGLDPRFTSNTAYQTGYNRGVRDCRDGNVTPNPTSNTTVVKDLSDAKVLSLCTDQIAATSAALVTIDDSITPELLTLVFRPQSSLNTEEQYQFGFDETRQLRMIRAKTAFDAGKQDAASNKAANPSAHPEMTKAYTEGFACGNKL